MTLSEPLAYAILCGYFGLIGLSFFLVFQSILSGKKFKDLFSSRPFLFLRIAFGALLCTWYFMLKFMHSYAYLHSDKSVGAWLSKTGLFEQAWSIVCAGPGNWWWSSFICTWTLIFTAVIWSEGGKRGIRYPWAYMLLGQLVAISVATSLFIAALALHPRNKAHPNQAPPRLFIPLLLATVTIYLVSQYVGTERFLSNLLWMHGLLLVALISPRGTDGDKERFAVPWPALYGSLLTLSAIIHTFNTSKFSTTISGQKSFTESLYRTLVSHPAQSSISLDVVWVAFTLVAWYVSSGSFLAVIAKVVALLSVGMAGVISYTGVNWSFVVSVLPIAGLAIVGFSYLGLGSIRNRNTDRRRELMSALGIKENEVIPGTNRKAPTSVGHKTLVGFFHPYCNSGGGGERVLWSAIAFLQRTQPDVVSLVYSGDYPDASKDQIIAKVHERFSITLSPQTLHFIPLPSRYLISDNYWKHFTLLNQSLGSVALAWQGLCGKDGLWGDIFIDTMGYAFTFPFVRLIAGSDITVAAYVHYPTVSTDMVKRVRAREAGVESGGASGSWLKTQIKLVYYRIFTALYSFSLLFAEEIMTNSSWTQAHISSLLTSAKSSFLASFFLLDDKSILIKASKGEESVTRRSRCQVVFPPCDTKALEGLGKLESRKREIVSLAQFRPEKEHSKQLHALAQLLDDHPENRIGSARVTLTLMGGSRNEGDESRVKELRTLAERLNIKDNVEFVVNAPYPEIVRRLGEASIGLNTMQDEHFGINIVEFMAAGLIPIVHASAGPMMDIVVPYKGQKTASHPLCVAKFLPSSSFHGTTSESFASALHEALSLPAGQAKQMRLAARASAGSKFSQEAFERGWLKTWSEVTKLVEERRRE